MYNKKLHAETFYYARFCAFRYALFFTKTLSVKCSGELGVKSKGVVRKLMKLLKFWLICVPVISGCATGYQKYSWAGGYKDKLIGDNTYLVEYYGNGTTSPQTVDVFWNKRAAEICPNGFNVVETVDGANQGSFTSGATTFSHPWKKATISCK